LSSVPPAREPVAKESESGSAPIAGWCAREVEEELPGLRLLSVEAALARRGSPTGASPADIRSRLQELSNRLRGAAAIAVRRQPVPAAYRVFFRHIGLDPDAVRTPIEAAVLERMLRGGFLSGGLLEDVLTIALVDTGVPVWALDAGCVDGPLGIRSSLDGERLGRSAHAPPLLGGRLVVADASTPLAVLFGELAPGHAPVAATRRLMLFAVQVAGVPELYVEEALWNCRSALEFG
jgi:DNA/RNA-binding domain of Phe-tRNA-synthetase-like protein